MNKIKRLLLGAFAVVSLWGCQDETVEKPSFEVELDSLTFKVGEPVTFKFSGNADYIGFYSGDKVTKYPEIIGNRYQYKDRTLADGAAYLQFSSLLQNVGQTGSLSLLASTDFNGLYDTDNVKKATWTDITSKFTLSSGGTTAIASGLADISEFKDKPVFFAFRYIANAGSQQPTWTITNLSAVYYAKGEDTEPATLDTFTVATLNPAWRAVNVSNASQVWSVSTTQLKFTGGNATAAANEDWIISKDFYLNRVPTDKSIPIKTYTDAMLKQYVVRYTKPGIYKVDFVANNANSKSSSSVHKSLVITVIK